MAWDPKTFEYYDDGSQFDLARPQTPPEDPHADWKRPTVNLGSMLEKLAIAAELRGKCESQIEVQFGMELKWVLPPDFTLFPQFEFRRWRMDFAVISRDMEVLAFIECDGAEFHSTAAQLTNDRRKDEAAAAANIKMFRFTGKEIYHAAPACAAVVLEHVRACA